MTEANPHTIFDEVLACVRCGAAALSRMGGRYECRSCKATYPIRDGIPAMMPEETVVGVDVPERMEFWNEGWRSRNAQFLAFDRDEALSIRQRFFAMLRNQKYPAVTEITPETAKGKFLLNIGCGGGEEGLLFAGYVAKYIGIDFSYNAVRYTQALIGKLNYTGACYQAAAERLPLRDASMHIVYTNGVLHHTPNTLDALKEIHRILSPGGKAVIGVYATWSVTFFWYRLRAALTGNFSKDKMVRWLDENTEGEWQTEGRKNKYTRTYTKDHLATLLIAAGFEDFRILQSQIQIKDLPVLGRIARAVCPQSVGEVCLGPYGMMLIAICAK